MKQKRLLLIGWESAGWDLIRPLMAAGHLPVLARLTGTGTTGDLGSPEPLVSPMLWTSMVTGKGAYDHGITGYRQVTERGEVLPVTASSLRVKALWDILAGCGLRSHVVNWPATHGAQPDGCLVSDRFPVWPHRREDAPEDWPPPPEGTYWPEDLGGRFNALRVSPWEMDHNEILRLLVPEAERVDQRRDRRLQFLLQQLSETFSVHAAACALLEEEPAWNLFALCFRSLGEICARFLPFHPPQRAGVPDGEFALYRDVVTGTCRLYDLLLARLINLAGPGAAVVLVSAHSLHSGVLRPGFHPQHPAPADAWLRSGGIFCASGPGFVPGGRLTGARLTGLAPTILTWFGLPAGSDMEETAWREALSDPVVPSPLPSWESTGAPRRPVRPPRDSDRRVLLDLLAACGGGGVPDPDPSAARAAENENDWNLARTCLDAGRWQEALPLLERVWQLSPERSDYARPLAICYLRLGLRDEAAAVMKVCQETPEGPTPGVLAVLAHIALESGQAAQALAHLRAVEAGMAGEPGPAQLEILGRTQFALREWDACAVTCRRLLALDPAHPPALLQLARYALHRGEPEEAVAFALRGIEAQYGNAAGHFLLGAALLRLQRPAEALAALKTALKFNPKHAPAYRLCGAALESLGETAAAEGAIQLSRLHRRPGAGLAEIDGLRRASAGRREALRKVIAERRMNDAASRPPETGLPAGCVFTLVSGLPRSGTSLMMQMLRAGGLELMTDGRRVPDADNPEGYWEWEEIRKLPRQPLLIEQAQGRVVKVVAPLLGFLPSRHRYKVIFMTRPVDQVVASQAAMLARRGAAAPAPAEQLRALQEVEARRCLAALRESPVADVLEVPYPALVSDPLTWAEKVAAFLGAEYLPQAGAMAAAVRPDLHRQR